MDSLKALVAQKRKITSEVYEGKKYVKRADLEAAELRRLREEEQRELEAKVGLHKREGTAQFNHLPYRLLGRSRPMKRRPSG